ncbi:MAG: hypothetical protein M3460_20820 [Actinomycetota bacterium]|nr:hypothetical protein [Actinomycetota bacterium]
MYRSSVVEVCFVGTVLDTGGAGSLGPSIVEARDLTVDEAAYPPAQTFSRFVLLILFRPSVHPGPPLVMLDVPTHPRVYGGGGVCAAGC